MGEPQQIGWDASVAKEHAEQDRLLARIEDEDRISGWCWQPMIETLSYLRELPDRVAWIGTRYLQAVVLRGDLVFGPPEHYQRKIFDDEHRPTVECRCGTQAPTDRPARRGGREITVAECPSCGITSVLYDGEPYPRRTLVAQGFH